MLHYIPVFCFWLFVAATLLQMALWWGVFKRLASFQAPCEKRNDEIPVDLPGASVVVCARNEAVNLRRHLPFILTQEYPGDWEVVVVDDASTDETAIVLQEFSEKNERLRVIRVNDKVFPGKKYALSQGVAAARFGHLFLTDADCEPASVHWLRRMAETFMANPETEIVLGYGPVKATGTKAINAWNRFETAHTAIQYFSFALAGMPYMGVGRNLAWKRQVFDRTGGFSGHLELPSGDDDLLVNAAAIASNVAICLHPESFVYSAACDTRGDWFRQKRRHLSAGSRYKPLHKLILAMVSLSHTLHYFLFAVLLLTGFGTVSVVFIYLFRSFSLLYLYGRILPKLHEFRLLSQVPIYDTLLAAYYGAFVPLSLINNRHAHTWK